MNPIPIGIVGLHFGKIIVDRLRSEAGKPYFQVAAVCGQTASKVAAVSSKLGVKGYVGLDALLDAPDIPVIGLFTGPEGRAAMIRQIIRAGKDVITTKPFETDGRAAREVLEEAQALGRYIYVNSPSPLPSPDLLQIEAWSNRFDLGRPLACRADTWISYREQADGSWYDDSARCPSPPIFRLGIYPLHDVLRLMGEVEQVSSVSSRIFTGRPTPDHAQLGMKFRSGALANIFASFCLDDGQKVRHSFVLNYERATVYRNIPNVPDTGRPVADGMTELMLIGRGPEGQWLSEKAVFHEKSGDYQWKRIYDHMQGRAVSRCPTALILEGIRVVEAMARSERSGRWERV